MEMWDILDKNGNPTEKRCERTLTMKEGEYHLVVSAWIKRGDGTYLITRRHPEKPYGGCWEIPGGCAVAGENSLEAVLREIREETGLCFGENNGRRLYRYRRECDFCDVWLFEAEFDEKDITLQEGETVDFAFATMDEIYSLMDNSRDLSLDGASVKNVGEGKFIPKIFYPYIEVLFALNQKREYHVPTMDKYNGNMPDWSRVPGVAVDIWLWTLDYTPKTTVQMALVDGGIALRMTCLESNPRAECNEYGMEVWVDSCMECFIGKNYLGDYINVEINSHPNCLIGVGDGRADRKAVDEFGECPKCESHVEEGKWWVQTYLTPELLTSIFGDTPHKGESWYGNFFKVGEYTAHPHYGMWSPIKAKEPDFHRPECFGRIVFE